MATVVVLTTRRGLGPGRPGDDKEGRPSTTRALVGALLGHEDDVGGSAATSTRDGWEDAGTPSWRDALVSARAALDASGARDVGLGGELRVHIGGCATSFKSVETQTSAWVNPGSRGA